MLLMVKDDSNYSYAKQYMLDRIYRYGYASRYVAISISSGIYSGLPAPQ